MNHITAEDFNRMATAILLKYMEYDNIPPVHRNEALQKFNKWLNEAEQTKLFDNKKEENEESI